MNLDFFVKRCMIVVTLVGIMHMQTGFAIRCYECVARLGPGESNECLTGDVNFLRRVRCIGPSVCAAYHYQSVIPGTPSTTHITRGCQAMRYGATCEDIFSELRANGQILPGQHTCSTCNSDLCNSANIDTIPINLFLTMSFVTMVYRVFS